MITRTLRACFVGLFCIALLACGASAQAQEFPTRPITLVVPFTAGGLSDIVARLFAAHLRETLRQPVIVDNKVGGSGLVATEYVLRAPRDGHTLMFASMQEWAITPLTFSTPTYDPEKDFAGVALVGITEMFLIASTALPAKDIKELIALVRANPGKYNYGSSGVGSFQHLTIAAFRTNANLDIVHVPYRGGPQVMTAITGDEISLALQSWGQSQPYISQGKIRMMAVAAPARPAVAPDIPTFAEAGVPGVDFPPAMGIVTASGVPQQVLEKLAAEFKNAMPQPAIQEAFNKYNITPFFAGPAEANAWMKSDRQKLAPVAAAAGLKQPN